MKRFSFDIWRRYYDKLHAVGELLKQYTHDKYDKDKKHLPGHFTKHDAAMAVLVVQIDAIHADFKAYMDSCGMDLPPPKWRYVAEDPTTHASDHSFAYKEYLL